MSIGCSIRYSGGSVTDHGLRIQLSHASALLNNSSLLRRSPQARAIYVQWTMIYFLIVTMLQILQYQLASIFDGLCYMPQLLIRKRGLNKLKLSSNFGAQPASEQLAEATYHVSIYAVNPYTHGKQYSG